MRVVSAVAWYRWKSKHTWSWRFCLQPVSNFLAACIFLGCWIMIKEVEGSKSLALIQLALWVPSKLHVSLAQPVNRMAFDP